jgi:hypothetical protein
LLNDVLALESGHLSVLLAARLVEFCLADQGFDPAAEMT